MLEGRASGAVSNVMEFPAAWGADVTSKGPPHSAGTVLGYVTRAGFTRAPRFKRPRAQDWCGCLGPQHLSFSRRPSELAWALQESQTSTPGLHSLWPAPPPRLQLTALFPLPWALKAWDEVAMSQRRLLSGLEASERCPGGVWAPPAVDGASPQGEHPAPRPSIPCVPEGKGRGQSVSVTSKQI